jgi:KDO2-lipid IV(A) lauroyltransferase
MPESIKKPDNPLKGRTAHYVSNVIITGLIRLALILPYTWRVRMFGAVVANFIGPLVGYRRRALENLHHVFPELDKERRAAIAKASLNNVGRTLIENYSTKDMLARMHKHPISGAGFEAIKAAQTAGRPIILAGAHLGNYETVRAALATHGFDFGGLYRNMSNPYFNAHYVKTMEAISGTMFPQGRKGTAGFVRHLKGGGQLCLLFDQHVFGAPVLDFVGKPARTAVSAAELALRYNALLVPYYGIRQADDLSFDTILAAPIPHSDPLTMTQALNDSLSAQIHAHPEQWLWMHRRWRPDDI